MSLLLRVHRPSTAERTRNRTGLANVFLKNMAKGERLTLSQAIELLRAKW